MPRRRGSSTVIKSPFQGLTLELPHIEFPPLEIPAEDIKVIKENLRAAQTTAAETEAHLQTLLQETTDPKLRKLLEKAIREVRKMSRIKI